MTKFRPQTPPILGQQIASMQDRIEELERNLKARMSGAVGGSVGLGTPLTQKYQGGKGTTGADGKLTVTFSPAYEYDDEPIVTAVAGGAGSDSYECQIVSKTKTQVVIIVVGMDVADSPVKTEIQDANHTHNVGPGSTDSLGAHVHTIPTGANQVAVQTDSAGQHSHTVNQMVSSGQSADHKHQITKVPRPVAKSGVTVYWISMPKTQ